MSATHRVVFAKERVLIALEISLRCLEEYNLNKQYCTQLILAKDLSGRCHEPSHARRWLPFYKQDNFLKRTKDMESTANIVSDD